MRQRLKNVFRGPVVFHPVLFAAFPILFLYAYNISQTSASQVWMPLGISVGAALAMWGVLSLILRSPAKAGLATAIFLGLFYSYGRLYDGLNYLGVAAPRHVHLLPTILFAWVCCVYFIGRANRDFRVTTRLLNVVAVAVIAINLINIAGYEIRLRGAEAEAPPETTQRPIAGVADLENLPDIYFIILDEYSHPDTMLEWYDYDIGWFIDGLEERGFFVAQGSKTHTPNTQHVLAQILEMEYLTWIWDWDESAREWVKTPVPHIEADLPSEEAYQRITDNRVVEFLRENGYQYMYFGSWLDVGRHQEGMEKAADLYFNYFDDAATAWVSEFQEILWNTTMLRPFYYRLVGVQHETAWRRQTVYTLAHLKTLTEVQGPKFVFAHFMCPHAHYVFDAEGGPVDPSNWQNYADKQFYLGQYIFISREIEEVVDVLQSRSRTPPIIIVQSDHGQRPHRPGIDIGPDEWRKILNAMYLPGMDYGEISESISPVNTFRLIFSHYFGADYPLLDD